MESNRMRKLAETCRVSLCFMIWYIY